MTTVDPCAEFKTYYSWFCCLAPLEKVTLDALIAIRVGALIEFVTKEYFDQAWTQLGGVVDDARYGMFIIVYHLRLETVDIDGQEVEVYFMDDDWWFKWLLWVGGCNAMDCSNGCFEIEYGK